MNPDSCKLMCSYIAALHTQIFDTHKSKILKLFFAYYINMKSNVLLGLHFSTVS